MFFASLILAASTLLLLHCSRPESRQVLAPGSSAGTSEPWLAVSDSELSWRSSLRAVEGRPERFMAPRSARWMRTEHLGTQWTKDRLEFPSLFA